jgi:hypothetical protein
MLCHKLSVANRPITLSVVMLSVVMLSVEKCSKETMLSQLLINVIKSVKLDQRLVFG